MGKITFLGVEGSGKSVLLLALINLFKAHEAEGWFLRPCSRDAFRFVMQAPEELSGDALPHQTTGLRAMAWTILYQNQEQGVLEVLDFPGELYRLAFLDAADSPNPEAFKERVEAHKAEIHEVLSHLIDSTQAYVLFNPSDAENLATNASNLDAVWVTNACLDFLHQLPNTPKITLLLTQVDKLSYVYLPLFDPYAYVKQHLSLIAHNFPEVDVVGVSAIGRVTDAYNLEAIVGRMLEDSPFYNKEWMIQRS